MRMQDMTSSGTFALLATVLLLAGASGAGGQTTGDEAANSTPTAAEIAAIDAADAKEAAKLSTKNSCPLGYLVCAPRVIVNKHSGLCLNVLNYGQHNGANVVQATNCALTSSRWYFSGGLLSMKMIASHSGQCLNVLNASTSNAANVVQAQDCTTLNSKWKITQIGWHNGEKLYTIRARHSNKCLNVLNWGTSNACNVVQADDCSIATSHWIIPGS